MKKKILLFVVMIIAIMSVLAISASCAVIYKTADGTELFRYVDEDANYDYDSYSGTFPKFDANNNALTWYITATETVDSDTVHTVESKITLGEAGSINANGAYTFTSPVTNKNTVSVNFPDDAGIKTWAFNSFGGYGSRKNNNILFVYCPNTLTAFANNPFQETQVIVVELDDKTPITSIPQNFAHEARNLETVNIPSSVTVINGASGQNGAPFYNNCSLKTVTFASNNTLKELKNSCFQNCSSLTSIELPDSVTTMGSHVFASCSSLKEIKLPNSLKTVKNHFLAWCSSLEVIRMGASFEYFANTGDNSFTYSTGKINEFYIPKTFYATIPTDTYQVSYAFHGATSNCKFFYCGTVDDFAITKANFLTQTSATSNNAKFINATVIDYATYLDNPDSYATGNYVICGYNSCDAFYDGAHGYDADCTTGDSCKNLCGLSASASGGHNNDTTLTYASGFTQSGTLCNGCKNEGCSVKTTETTLPIFSAKGYSLSPSGTAINGGYTVNLDVLGQYEQINGNLTYGIVIANTDKFDGKSFFDADKKVNTTKALQVEINDQYSNFDCSIEFGAPSNDSLNLIITAYVIEGDNVTFIQADSGEAVDASLVTGGSFKSVTLSYVVALQPAETKEELI